MEQAFTVTEIPHEECYRLLDSARFGRLAMCMHGEPDIFPVNFLVVDEKVVIKTAAGTKLFELTLNSAVALEADHIEGDEAWSVVLKGIARVVESFTEKYELDDLRLETWLPSEKPVYITIEQTEVSGRRFQRTGPSAAD